ncbi:unnamed protein product [Parnassius apollo]|uniref:(apollo) hypothetical protein n=1 Tax=Parnassius apollo TaxID=110799 RepID=A0A8S3Y490_PARAO|nr:unnamed protein product [Parnassius apollo]
MHRQLHHGSAAGDIPGFGTLKGKSSTIPFVRKREKPCSPYNEKKSLKLPSRTSSATRLFDMLRSRICRSRTLFVHPEEHVDSLLNTNNVSAQSECTSKALKVESTISDCSAVVTSLNEARIETYACHLCSFDADRITILDRHLLNDHKIGLENLLKLVMAKTKDGLNDERPISNVYGIRQPYYKPPDDIIEEGEFIIETITPKIKILRHAGVNTDLKWSDIPELKNNGRMIKRDIEKLIEIPKDENEKDELLVKMQSLNECMCKFVDSTNTLKKVLTKEFETKNSTRNEHSSRPVFDLGLGESEKLKCSSESFYF